MINKNTMFGILSAVLMSGLLIGYVASGRLRLASDGSWCYHMKHIVVCSADVWSDN